MIAYVESNFVLELVLEQEQVIAAAEILRLAEESKIEVAFPTFALMEPYWTIKNRGMQREGLCRAIGLELNQLRRSPSNQELVASLEGARQTMSELERSQGSSLERITQ